MVKLAKYNGGAEWSVKERAILRGMYEDGYTDEEISARLERTIGSVATQRRAMGLKRSTHPAYRKEFVIRSAEADYFPRWYKEHLKKQWLEQCRQTSTR